MAQLRKLESGGGQSHIDQFYRGNGCNDPAQSINQQIPLQQPSVASMRISEAGNMVDLDSNPTKLIEIVETGKKMLMNRGSLTTLSIANNVAKYFAIIPAAFGSTYPQLAALNIMRLATPNSAILSTVIFNALIIVALIPLAIKGVKYRDTDRVRGPRPISGLWSARPAYPRYKFREASCTGSRVPKPRCPRRRILPRYPFKTARP
jgi:hypothetical protein